MIAMEKFKFSAIKNGSSRQRVTRNEFGEVGRNQISAGQICYIKTFGLFSCKHNEGQHFKQENDMTVYQILRKDVQNFK